AGCQVWTMLCQCRFGCILWKATIDVAPGVETNIVMVEEECYRMHRLENFSCARSNKLVEISIRKHNRVADFRNKSRPKRFESDLRSRFAIDWRPVMCAVFDQQRVKRNPAGGRIRCH